MKKHRLTVDELRIDSFATSAAPEGARGTVRGHAGWYPTPSCGATETYGEASCFCLYPATHRRLCCNSDQWCTTSESAPNPC